MKAMILAAGRGERMRPLTDATPKPLLCAGGKPLIVWHLEQLAGAGFRDIVINTAWLGERIRTLLGDGARWNLAIRYSPEPPGALETAGGIAHALPLLGEAPFLVVNGDIWCDWDFTRAFAVAEQMAAHETDTPDTSAYLAHLILVDNPAHHAGGDFCLDGNALRYAADGAGTPLTYAGISIFSPAFFTGVPAGAVMKLRPLLDAGIGQHTIRGEYHAGRWSDIGTPERLHELDRQLAAAARHIPPTILPAHT